MTLLPGNFAIAFQDSVNHAGEGLILSVKGGGKMYHWGCRRSSRPRGPLYRRRLHRRMPDGFDTSDVSVARCRSEAGVGVDLLLGRWVCIRRGGTLPAALEAVALAVNLQDVHVVGEAI